jgi:NAD(P)H-hydrate repair Nnr-like enzyme with NAD(P)H-hydrate dehydratase domain
MDFIKRVYFVHMAGQGAWDDVREWLQSVLHTPDPAYAAYLKKRKRTNCEASAQLHNTTTAEQRARAVKVLKGYEDDVRKLIRYNSS